MTGAQILWECLVREGVTDVFGYPGGAILPAYDAMLDYPIRHVLVRHEQGADAHGRRLRARERPGRRRDRDLRARRHQPGHRHRHGDDGLVADRLHHRPGAAAKLIGSDAFQETDITGITLPITKHNYLVTRADDIAPAIREAFYIARVRPPGPGARGHHQGRAAGDLRVSTGTPPRRSCRGYRPTALPRRRRRDRDALELINGAERPVILAGHGVMLVGATERQCVALAERGARSRSR